VRILFCFKNEYFHAGRVQNTALTEEKVMGKGWKAEGKRRIEETKGGQGRGQERLVLFQKVVAPDMTML